MKRANVLAALACFGLLLLWFPLMQWLGWSGPPPAVEAPAVAPPPAEVTEPPQVPDLPPSHLIEEPVESVEPVDPAPDAVAPALTVRTPTAGYDGRRDPPVDTAAMIVRDVLVAPVDLGRGGVTEVELLDFLKYDYESNVVLGSYQYPFLGLELGAENWSFGPAGKVVEQGPLGVVIERDVPGRNLLVREAWQVDPETPYRINYQVTIENRGDNVQLLDDLAVGCGGMTYGETGTKSAKLSRVGTVDLGIDIAYSEKDRPLSLLAKGVSKMDAVARRELAGEDALWVALHNKYFLFYMALEEGMLAGLDVGYVEGDEALEEGAVPAEKWLHARAYLPSTKLDPGETVEWSFSGYAGPKEYKLLEAVRPGLSSVMRLDKFLFGRASWMGVIAKGILRSLVWIQGRIDRQWGYGVAIIVITVIVKTLFWPLTHKSTVSMRKMQTVQPLVQEIRAKYKDDAQLMNRKVWDLYREHKVNPMGGCLPILCQIPVFFALFNTLRGAIELRQASFLWIGDLSLPDTLPGEFWPFAVRPLAILMGLTMLLQQRLAPTTADPSQKRMMTFMSVFFIFIFYGMPAGLTLYWTTNQVLTIAQNLISRRFEQRKK